MPEFRAPAGESVERRLLRVKDALDRDFSEEWNCARMVEIALLSPTHFRRVFRSAFGETPRGYLYRRRIERACHLLRSSRESVTSIAQLVGYQSLGTFTRVFVRLIGETPSQYRARAWEPVIPSCFAREVGRPRGSARAT